MELTAYCGWLVGREFRRVLESRLVLLVVRDGRGSICFDVRRAFRKQALKYHPDKTQGATTPLFQSLQTASQRAADPNHKPPPAAQPGPPPRTKPQQPKPQPAYRAPPPQPQASTSAEGHGNDKKKSHAASGAQSRDYYQYRVRS